MNTKVIGYCLLLFALFGYIAFPRASAANSDGFGQIERAERIERLQTSASVEPIGGIDENALPQDAPAAAYEFTDAEVEILARLVYAEAGATRISDEARLYVCATALNLAEYYGVSIERICTATTKSGKGRYFTVAPYVRKVTPTEACYRAVYDTVRDGKIDATVKCFRLGVYWKGYVWSKTTYITPICEIDGIFFSGW